MAFRVLLLFALGIYLWGPVASVAEGVESEPSLKEEIKLSQEEYLDEHDAPIMKRRRTRRQAHTDSGVVYTRWGHHECPSHSSLVYSGLVASPDYRSSGGGADQLCLPSTPIYDRTWAGVGSSRSFLYGVEYQTTELPAQLFHDLPCAVCEATNRLSLLNVPARNVCPSSAWTLEYRGYLMAERDHSVHHRSLHICVDRDMETLVGTAGYPSNYARGLMNFVEGRCSPGGGGLPCRPYVDGYELTCAVCTK